MSNTFLILLLVIAVIVIWYLLATRNKTSLSPRTQRKEENKEKVLTLFQTKDEIANNDVENLLGVSDATATRYLDELEKEGRVIQIGKTGKAVRYVRSG